MPIYPAGRRKAHVASGPCSTRRSSRPTTCAGSTPTSSTRRARTRSGAPTWSSSSRGRSPSAATCGSPPRRWRARRSTAPPTAERTCSTSGESGLMEIRDRALFQQAMSEGQSLGHVRRGQVQEYDIWPAFVERVLFFVDVQEIRPLRVVIDAANGMAGVMLPPVLERLPIDAVPCYFEPDGSFPNHEPNPLLPENREFIVSKTLEEQADLGVAFDGDADRCFFVDDSGEFVPGDFVTALLAESVLEKEPGAKIIY